MSQRLVLVLGLMLASLAGGARAADPLVGAWVGQVHDGADSKPFYIRFDADKDGAPVMYWNLPESNILDYGPIPMVLHDGWYDELPQADPTLNYYGLKLHLSDDQAHLTGLFYYDGHDLPIDLTRGTIPAPPPDDRSGIQATPLWTFKTGAAIQSSPAVAGGVVYVGSDDANIYAVAADSGKELWRYKTGAAVKGPATVDGAYVYLLSEDGYLYKLARAAGKLAWRFDTHGAGYKRPDYDHLTSAAALNGGLLYIGSSGGALYALDPKTGKERWHFDTHAAVHSVPAVAADRVYFGSFDDSLYALDAKTGVLLWRKDTLKPVVSTPLVAGGRVYVGSRSTDFFALDAKTGAPVWSKYYWGSWVESSAVEREGVLYVGSSDYMQLFALKAGTGEELWRFNTGGEAWPIPAVSQTRVYMGAVGLQGIDRIGAFYAVDRATGKLIWRYDMPATQEPLGFGVGGSPALGGGRVFFGGLDGNLYAFAAVD